MTVIQSYFRPKTVSETLNLLKGQGSDSAILAGGQSLMPMLKSGVRQLSTLIDIGSLDELRYIRKVGETINIGAATSQRDIELSDTVQENCPIIAEAISLAGSRVTRNRGTIGGSIANADPRASLCVVLLLLNAKVLIRRFGRERLVDIQDIFLGPNRTCLELEELLIEVQCPIMGSGVGWAFSQVAHRPGEYGIVNAGALVRAKADKNIDRFNIAVGGTAPFATRLPKVERFVLGKKLSKALLDDCLAIALTALKFSDNPISSVEYRQHAVITLLRRNIIRAAQQAGLSLLEETK